MKATHQIIVSWCKDVDRWSNETGAEGKGHGVDGWHRIFEISFSCQVVDEDILNAIRESDRYGVADTLCHWPDEPGRFTTNRIEDDEGNPDDNGRWLADYDVWVETRKVFPAVPYTSNCGFKSIDE